MKDLAQLIVLTAVVVLPVPLGAGSSRSAPPPVLSHEHLHPSGAFSFRTPDSWMLLSYGPEPQALEAKGDGLVVRFLFRRQEVGFDSLHVSCMLDRLAGQMESQPRVEYEYDFLTGTVGELQVLDSAFKVRYDYPVMGHRDWRQRNLTVVGKGQSLCVITYCPTSVWRRSPEKRVLLDGIVKSVAFKPWP